MTARTLRFALLIPVALCIAGCGAGKGQVRGEVSEPPAIISATEDRHGDVAVAVEEAVFSPEQATGTDLAANRDAVVQEVPANDAALQEELDFEAIYGGAEGSTRAYTAAEYDPWENWNRRMHRFNDAVDRNIAKPLANAYVKVVPEPVRKGVGNFFNNLGQPVSAVNALLQGKPKQAGQALGRFVMNFTLGIGGVFDPASDAGIPYRTADFGQTLGVWGWKDSRYLVLPLFGPRTVRDSFGLAGDAPLSPMRQVSDSEWRIGLQGLSLVDMRTQLFAVDSLREGAADDYALVRDAWMQRRNYQIQGDRPRSGNEDLPDYLLDDTYPTVPVDSIPIPN